MRTAVAPAASPRRASLRPRGARWALAPALALLMAATLGARRPDGVARWDRGGIIVYHLRDDALPQMGLSAVFRAGEALDPPERRGVARVTAAALHLALRDAGFAAGGGGAEVHARPWWVCLTLRLPAGAGLAAFAAALGADALTDARIATARAAVAADLGRAEATPLGAALRHLAARVLGEDHPGRFPRADEVARVGAEDVRAFHRAYYRRNNLWLAEAGPWDVAAADAAVRAAFEGWDPGRVQIPPLTRPAPAPPGWTALPGDRPLAAAAGVGDGRWAPDRFAAAVLLQVADARLQADDALGGAGILPGDPALWYAWAGGDGAQARLTDVLDGLARGAISEAEVADARDALRREAALAVRASAQVTRGYAASEAMGYAGDQWRRDPEKVARVTTDKVRRLAAQRLSPGGRFGVTVGAPPPAAPAQGTPP